MPEALSLKIIKSPGLAPALVSVPISKSALPVFLIVTSLCEPVCPTRIVEPKSRDIGVTSISGSDCGVPRPFSSTRTGFSSVSFEGMVRVPDLSPMVVGEKTRVMFAEVSGANGPEMPLNMSN